MSTQQDIYAAGSENRPPMLNKENYVPWSSRLLRYAKSRPNGKLIYNSIMNGPYVRRMIPEPGDADREVPVPETLHEQTDDELTVAEIKQMEADDQAIQTILLGLPEDIYAAVDSCETAQEIWLRVQQMMKGSDIGIQEKKAKLFNEWERFTSTDGESIESYYHRFSKLMNDFKRNKHFPEKIASNLKFLNNLQPEWSRHVTIVHQTKDLHTTDYTQLYDFLKYNQKEIAQPGMNMGQDRQMRMVGANGGNQFRQYAGQNGGYQNGYNAVQNVGNQVVQDAVQNQGVQNIGNQNGQIVVPGITNQNPNGNGNVVAARAEGNATGNNGNQIRCYNCRGLGHLARNCTVRPRRRDAAYLQTQLLIAQKEEAGIQLQAEEFDLMAAAADLDEIEEVNANCILMANLQQASTSGTQTDKAPIYDSDRSVEVHNYDNCYDNEIFNMFTQEEQYTELLKPIPEPHQVQQCYPMLTSISALVLLNEEQTDICHVDVRCGGLWFGTPVKGRNTLWHDMICPVVISIGPIWGCDRLVIRAKVIENQIMVASSIAISSDSSDESVGSPPSRVILFGDIPNVIPSTSVVAPETSTIAPVISSAAPMVETNLVTSPIGLCGLVPYSGSDSDSLDEMSSAEHISPLPAILPFLCTDSSEAPNSFDGPPSQDPYVPTVARWRSRVTARPSSSSEFPIAHVTAPPEIRQPSAILIRPGEAIPFGRPYRTHLNGPRKLLTARKRVGPLPAHRLASRHASPRSSDHRSSSSSSSSDSSPVHSSGLDASDQAHSGSSTRDVSPRLCYPPRRAPRHSEAFCHWCAAPLSTLYPPTTSESSSGDSSERPLHSSSHSAGPSRKRCRPPVNSVPSSTPVIGSLAPTRVDLLPPRKRFRDSYSSKASIEEDTEIDPIETEVEMELGIGDEDDVRNHVEIDPRDVRDDTEEYEADTSARNTVEVGIDLILAPIVEEEIVETIREDSSDSSGTRDCIVRIIGIETVQRRLEADQLIARG
ncbi:retrovirus-related pol polyprotein from transposon TNT 1-94 [Tanacetum coccineum]